MNRIYMDYAATTPIRGEVVEVMTKCMKENFGNASSRYKEGATSKKLIDEARGEVANLVGSLNPESIVFTSGGSEGDNWVLKSVAYDMRPFGNHIITTKIEHPAILNTCEFLETRGVKVTYLDVNSDGFVDPADVERAITKDTILISVMMVNNEIGTIQPIREIGDIARKYNVLFHTDAVQAVGSIDIDVEELKVDFLTMSAHKFYGPKGIGALYVRDRHITSLIHGGEQEFGMRAGTENVPAIVGMGCAAKIAKEKMKEYSEKLLSLRNYFLNEVSHRVSGVKLNGSLDSRHPGNLNLMFDGIENDSILMMLDAFGISVSTGSACHSHSLSPSHVLRAIGLQDSEVFKSIRFTLGDHTTKEDIDHVVRQLKFITNLLRE